MNAKHIEIVAGYEICADEFGLSINRDACLSAVVGEHAGKRMISRLESFVGLEREIIFDSPLRQAAIYKEEFLRIFYRQAAKEKCISQAEDRRVCANTKGQRNDSGRCEPGRFS